MRNEIYTFTVEGGDDDSNSAEYHPFYITNDPVGGYAQKTEDEKKAVQIYAGRAGRICIYCLNTLTNYKD